MVPLYPHILGFRIFRLVQLYTSFSSAYAWIFLQMADSSLSETPRKNDANSGKPFCSCILRIFMEYA